jgi:hypothetical protein
VIELVEGDSTDEEVIRRWRILVDHLARELALDVAAKAGFDTESRVRELFCMEGSEDA